MLDQTQVAERASLTEEEVRQIVRNEIDKSWKKDPAARKVAIIASKGTLDWAYPPLNLGAAAAASGMEVSIFFTFYGLNIIHKDFERKLQISPVGNPAMPLPMAMPDLLLALPGMIPFATRMMRSKFKKQGLVPISELQAVNLELGVRLIACDTTLEVFGYRPEDFIDGVEFGGAGAFLSQARRAHITAFV
jgi:peroxiredoxin family protein